MDLDDPDGFHDCMDDPAMMDELFYESGGKRLVMSTGALPWGAACTRGVPEVPKLVLGTS